MPGTIPIRRDSDNGLTVAQFKNMPSVISKRVAKMKKSNDAQDILDAATLEGDIPVWEAAAKQLDGEEGKWSITWSKVTGYKESDEEGEDEDGDANTAAEVIESFAEVVATEVALAEIGARNSKSDMGSIQAAHDSLVKLGAQCAAPVAESVTYEYTDDTAPETIAYNESGWGEVEQVTFAEADPEFNDDTREVTITPIRPGPGNKKDGFFYPSKTIKEAVEAGRFNNVKMYANHPRKSDERDLPERSVTDWVGVIKETTWDETHQRPRSRLKVLDEGVWRKFREAPEHIAYSVLGGGRARRGRVDGRDARIVESMDKVRSVDWVTEAGAGGGITFAESADEEFDMEITELTIEQVREGNPDLYDAIIAEANISEADGDEGEAEAKPKDNAAAKPEDAKAATPEKAVEDKPKAGGGDSAKAGKDAAPAPTGYVSQADFDALKKDFDAASAKVEKAETKEAETAAAEAAADIVEAALTDSLLPNKGKDYVQARFAEATVGDDFEYADEDALKEAVDAEIAAVKALTGKSGSSVTGLGASSDDSEGEAKTLRESKEQELMDRVMGHDDLPKSRDASEAPEGMGEKVESIASRL